MTQVFEGTGLPPTARGPSGPALPGTTRPGPVASFAGTRLVSGPQCGGRGSSRGRAAGLLRAAGEGTGWPVGLPGGARSARPGQPGVGSARSLVTAPCQHPRPSALPGCAGLSRQDGPRPGAGRDSARHCHRRAPRPVQLRGNAGARALGEGCDTQQPGKSLLLPPPPGRQLNPPWWRNWAEILPRSTRVRSGACSGARVACLPCERAMSAL